MSIGDYCHTLETRSLSRSSDKWTWGVRCSPRACFFVASHKPGHQVTATISYLETTVLKTIKSHNQFDI